MGLQLSRFLSALMSSTGRPASTSASLIAANVGPAPKFSNPTFVTHGVNDYTNKWGFKESNIAKQLRLKTANRARSIMMGHPAEVALFSLLLSSTGAQKVIEVGVFTGYTTLTMAQALGEGGMIAALDVSEEYCPIGQKYWKEAGVEDKIDLQIAPAVVSLEKMLENGEEGTYDFAFIDANKTNYKAYYKLLLTLIRPNGIIAIDNVLWSGRVFDESIPQHVNGDERVEHVLLPFADGVTLVRKK